MFLKSVIIDAKPSYICVTRSLRICASACHEGNRCTARSASSACRGGSRCSPRSCFSSCQMTCGLETEFFDHDAAVLTTRAHRGVASVRARARRAAMRRLGARGGAARARSASLALAAFTLACLWSADAFSIGIDLGSESTTVAASRSGGSARDVSVVPDDRGGRSSPSLVGFTEKHAARVFGADAESLRATCPRCVFSDPRSLMAVPLSALRDAASGGGGDPRGYASLDR